MKIPKASYTDLPLMSDEELVLYFGEKSGLRADVGPDKHGVILTNQRVIKLDSRGKDLEVKFVALKDAYVAEVKDNRRGIKPIVRIGLLAAGSWAALLVINEPILEWFLAILLGLGSLYHLVSYVRSAEDGSVIIRGEHSELGVPFRHGKAGQAYLFVNRFFEAKLAPISTEDQGAMGEVWPDMTVAETTMYIESGEEISRPAVSGWQPTFPIPFSNAAQGLPEESSEDLGDSSARSDESRSGIYEQMCDTDSEDVPQ